MTFTKKKASVYPKKTTINLVMKEGPATGASKTVLAVIVIIVLVAAVAKFGVIDRLNMVSAAEKEASNAEASYSAMKDYTSGFSALQETYGQYATGGFTEAELALVDRLDILSLIEDELMSSAKIATVTAVENIVSVKLSGITLEQLSALLSRLNANDIVSYVVISSVDSTDSNNAVTTATMTITLKDEGSVGT